MRREAIMADKIQGTGEWGISNSDATRINAEKVGTRRLGPSRCEEHGQPLEDGICPFPNCEKHGLQDDSDPNH
jgi:hypothetical protein